MDCAKDLSYFRGPCGQRHLSGLNFPEGFAWWCGCDLARVFICEYPTDQLLSYLTLKTPLLSNQDCWFISDGTVIGTMAKQTAQQVELTVILWQCLTLQTGAVRRCKLKAKCQKRTASRTVLSTSFVTKYKIASDFKTLSVSCYKVFSVAGQCMFNNNTWIYIYINRQ